MTLLTATFTTPRGTPVEMVYREGTNDWNTLRSCLTEDEYDLGDRSLSGVCVDVGAHIGGVTLALAIDNPAVRVVAIEPVPANVSLLRNNVERNGIADRVTVIAGAVGDGSRVTIRYGYRGDPALEHHAFIGNITLAHGLTLDHDEVEYVSLTLGDVLDLNPEAPSLLKIDTEGAEYPFLGSAASYALFSIETIVGEAHNNDGHDPIPDMLALLDATHRVTFTGPAAGPLGFVAERR